MDFIKASNRPFTCIFSSFLVLRVSTLAWIPKVGPPTPSPSHLLSDGQGRAGRRTIVVSGLEDGGEVLGPAGLSQDSHTGQAALLTGKV